MHWAPVLLPTLVHGLHVAARGPTQEWLCSDRYTAAAAPALAMELAEATCSVETAEMVTISRAIEAVATTKVAIDDDESAASLLALP